MSRVYFTDRDLGKTFPALLREAGLTVEAHHDHFEPGCPDEEWLAHVGANGWVAITHETKIRYKPNEKAAVLHHGVRLLVVIGKAPYPELARNFVASRAKIESFLSGNPPPLIAKIYRPSPGKLEPNPTAAGRIERWYPR